MRDDEVECGITFPHGAKTVLMPSFKFVAGERSEPAKVLNWIEFFPPPQHQPRLLGGALHPEGVL